MLNMINLLPKRYHAQLVSAYRLRVVTVFLWGVASVLLAASLLFGGFCFLVRNERLSWGRLETQIKSQLEIMREKKQIPSNLGSPENLGQAVRLIKNLNQVSLYPSAILEQLSAQKGEGIKLEDFSYTREGEDKITIILGGTHLSRQSLVSFVDRLKTSRNWIEVDAPLSNFIKDEMGEFSVSLQVAPPRLE